MENTVYKDDLTAAHEKIRLLEEERDRKLKVNKKPHIWSEHWFGWPKPLQVILFVVFLVVVFGTLGSLAVSTIKTHYKQEEQAKQAEIVKNQTMRNEKEKINSRLFDACRKGCPNEIIAVSLGEVFQEVWFKCSCILKEQIIEYNIPYPNDIKN